MRTRRKGRAVLAAAALLALATGAVMSARGRGGPVVRTVALDAHPGSVTFDPSGARAYIQTYVTGNNGVGANGATSDTVDDTRLSILDLRTGAVSPTIDLGFTAQATAFDARRGRLILIGSNEVALVDGRSGRVAAHTSVDGLLGAVAVDSRRGRIYVAHDESSSVRAGLAVLDARTGNPLQEAGLLDDAHLLLGEKASAGAPAVDARTGHVFLPFTVSMYGSSAMTDSVAMLDAAGHLLRTTVIGRFSGPGSSTSAALVDAARGRVVVPNQNTGGIAILDARSGRLARALRIGARGPMPAGMIAPALGGWDLDARTGRLFVATAPRLMCPSPSAAQTRGCRAVGPPPRLYMVDTRDGRVLRRLLPGVAPGLVTVDARAGYVLVQGWPYAGGVSGAAGATTLYALDAATGALARRVLLGRGDYPLVDPLTGRVYSVAGDGAPRLLDLPGGRRIDDRGTGDAAATWPQGFVDVVGGRVVALRDNQGLTPPTDPLGWVPRPLRRLLPWRPSPPRAIPGTVTTYDVPR